jgi:hypothetical protein
MLRLVYPSPAEIALGLRRVSTPTWRSLLLIRRNAGYDISTEDIWLITMQSSSIL